MNDRICLLGIRGTGKTTYLATLASHCRGSCAAVEIKDSRLLSMASLIKTGGSFKAGATATSYRLDIKKPSSWFSLLAPPSFLPLEICDICGKTFENLVLTNRNHYEKITSLLTNVNGCIIFISDYDSRIDAYNSDILKTFTELIANKNLFLAIAANKVERGELWPSRLSPETDLFENLYPKTTALLRNRIPPTNLRFFALSNFGILGQGDPRPNKITKLIDGKGVEVLRDASRWQPYNLFTPLQWLISLKRARRLRSAHEES
jgi:hypothetical protein